MAVPDGLPMRLPLTAEQRLQNQAAAQPGLAKGRSPSLKPNPPASAGGGLGRLLTVGTFAVVIHGDDGTVERPIVDLVYWVGAATPANGEDWDIWYVADVT